jgi:hypothetical protein
VTGKIRAFAIIWLILLTTSFSSNVFAYWPIVFQVAKDGSDFASIRGPVHVRDGGVIADSNESLTETSATYMLLLREFVSFTEEAKNAMEVYLQIYPADIRAYEYGKTGDVLFNQVMVKRFNLTLKDPDEKLFFDESNYRFTHSGLDFPIPMYGYLSDQSLFLRVPVRLLDTNMNVTFRMDPSVLWEVSIVSIIAHIIPEEVSPWWKENLPIMFGIVFAELISVSLTVKFWKWRILRKH